MARVADTMDAKISGIFQKRLEMKARDWHGRLAPDDDPEEADTTMLSEVEEQQRLMTKGDLAPQNAQNEGITHGMKMRIVLNVRVDRKVPSCIRISLSHTCITIS